MESPQENDVSPVGNTVSPLYEGEESRSDDWIITKIAKVDEGERNRSNVTSKTYDSDGSGSSGRYTIHVETVLSSDSESDLEEMGTQAYYSGTSTSRAPPIKDPIPEREAVATSLPLPPTPPETPFSIKVRVLSDESRGTNSIFSGTTVAAANTHQQNKSTDESLGTQEDTAISSHDDHEANKKGNKKSSSRHLIFCGIIVALLLASAASIFFGTGLYDRIKEEQQLRGATEAPTIAPTSQSPVAPTLSPTQAPTAGNLIDILRPASGDLLDNPSSPQFQAFQWMAFEDSIATDPQTLPARVQQRFALVLLYTSLLGEIPSFAVNDECEWPTVTCSPSSVEATGRADGHRQVTEIRMARLGFTGNIPSEIKLLRDSLEYLDLAENEFLHGTIPDDVYELTNLRRLYLHDNVLRGTISESIGQLQLLEDLYLQNNRFEGSIPYNLGSRRGIRPLRRLILSNNRLEGTIPTNMALPSAIYVDLSFNNLGGELPADIGTSFASLRQIHLDHNHFSGTIPESYSMAGNGTLAILSLDNNMLAGGLPSTWVDIDDKFAVPSINTIKVLNNNLTEGIDNNIFTAGEAPKP